MISHRPVRPGEKINEPDLSSFRCFGKRLCFLISFTLLVFFSSTAQEQEPVRIPEPVDTNKTEFIKSMKSAGEESMSKFRKDKIAARQDQILDEIRKIVNKAKDYLKKGVDTSGMSRELVEMESWYKLAIAGVFVKLGRTQTHRNLETTEKILTVLSYRVEKRKAEMDKFQANLVNFRYQLDSLSGDTILNHMPSDSIELANYLKKIVIIRKEVQPTDSAMDLTLADIQEMELQISYLNTNLSSDLETIENYRERLTFQSFSREVPNLWNAPSRLKAFSDILHDSILKGSLAFIFYLKDNIFKCIILLAVFLMLAVYLTNLKKIHVQRNLLQKLSEGQLVLRYPALSALMISVSLLQFVFIDPPYSFNAAFLLVSSICITFIFKNFISRFWMNFWLIIVSLFVLATVINLILEVSREERWLMIVLAASTLVTGIFSLMSTHRKELKEKWVLYFMAFVVLLESGSIVTNLIGRYNLSKTLMVTGLMNAIIGVTLLWTIRLINEALALGSNIYTNQDKKLFYINFERLGRKVPLIFYFFLIIGWFILITRNAYIFKLISEPFWDFLVSERKIGSYTFTLHSLIIFVVIMVGATIISKVVSYFASSSDSRRTAGLEASKPGFGSWILLVRIAIMSLGLFLAFAAAGIPMDKITIILGALGVGIGFGLQSLVNNLVSGLIIAFEKPVNVGDFVEVGSKSGTMKAIGFRSSIITTGEGAEVIMPNGELLNSHLVNWTLSDTRRGVEIALGIAYGTNLELVKKVLNDLLQSNNKILKYPEPGVLFRNFADSSINITISFWVMHVIQAPAIKSEVISAIDSKFKEHGIVIPFPQQDLHVQILNENGGKNR
jgi:small-conductance mechanosensitive channel